MAQTTITPVNSTALFRADIGKFQLISGSGMTADIVCDLKDCKDAVIALIDISIGGEAVNTFVLKSAEGNKDTEIVLTNGKLNVVRFTTKGIKDADGLGHFQIATDNGMGLDGAGAKFALIKCVDVVNH